jgi:hypothetical protein
MAMRFNPAGAVRFDLARGRVELGGEQVLIAADALADLCRAAGHEATVDFGRRLGTSIGRRVSERLAGAINDVSLEEAVDHLGGELALCGLGSLAIERWGRAMVLIVSGAPFGMNLDVLLGATLEGALQRAFGRDVEVVKLGRDDRDVRFFVTNASAAGRVREWIGAGETYADALARLQQQEARS